MALATLSVDLVAKLASFEGDLKRAARAAESSADRMTRAFGVAKAGVAGLFAGLSVGVVTAAFRSVVNGVDALNDLSDATGASIEKLSSLENAAALTGTTMDTVGNALIKLNQALNAARPGSNAEQAFKALGLSVEDLRRLDPADALRQVAAAFAGFADDGNKARLTQELFGKSLREVAPLLKDLVEAGERNATVTKQQAEEAEKFNRELAAIQKNALDVARQLSGPLVASLNDTIERFRAGSAAGKGFFETLRDEQLKLLGLGGLDTDRVARLRNELAGVDAVLAKGINSDQRKVALQEKRLQILGQLAKAEAAVARSTRPANEGGGGLANRGLPSLPDVLGNPPRSTARAQPSQRTLEAAGLDEATLSALRRIEQTDVAKIASLNATLDKLFGIRASGLGGDQATDEAIASVREELARLDPAAQAAARSAERLQSILAQTPTGQLDTVLADIELINREFENGARNTELWAEAIKVATSKLGGVAEEVQALGTFSEQAGRNIQDALGTSLEQALDGNFKSIGELWGNLLKQMVAQAAAARLNDFLFGNTFGGGGAGAGVAGAVLKGVFGGFFANGGTLGAGKWGIAGEAGPEVVRGPATIVPAGGMGGTTVVINNTINGDVSPATVRLIEGAMNRTKADILRSSRMGGAYAGAY